MRARSLARYRHAATALLVTATASILTIEPGAAADDLMVKYDQSQLWQLPRTPAEIIIGNPTIADIAIQGGGLLVITGKSFGITNVIALDAERRVIEERRVLVQRDEIKVVNLHKGGKRESYNCSPQCNPTITVGDDPQYFDVVAKTSERKIKMSEGQTDPNGGGGAQQ
jgi:hypothetical protein